MLPFPFFPAPGAIPSAQPVGAFGPQLEAKRSQVAGGEVVGSFGAFAFGIKWRLSEPTKYDGWVVQHVKVSYAGFDPKHPKDDGKGDYWEAWPVKQGTNGPVVDPARKEVALAPFGLEIEDIANLGRLYAYRIPENVRNLYKNRQSFLRTGRQLYKDSDDIFGLPAAVGYQGTVTFTGEAFYFAGTLPDFFVAYDPKRPKQGGVAAAGGLRSVLTQGNEGRLALWLLTQATSFSNRVEHKLTAKLSSGGLGTEPPAKGKEVEYYSTLAKSEAKTRPKLSGSVP
jgi:hypothetical protein